MEIGKKNIKPSNNRNYKINYSVPFGTENDINVKPEELLREIEEILHQSRNSDLKITISKTDYWLGD